MKASIRGTRTEKNLMTAFAGESMSVNRYLHFARIARQEGLEKIAAVLAETAENERAHAEIFSRYFEGGRVEIAASFPAVAPSDTKSNLAAAVGGEHAAWEVRYADFAKAAADEGFLVIAQAFRNVAIAENYHEDRFRRFLHHLAHGTVFTKKAPVRWHCRNCGYVRTEAVAPEVCPACTCSRAFFEVLAEEA